MDFMTSKRLIGPFGRGYALTTGVDVEGGGSDGGAGTRTPLTTGVDVEGGGSVGMWLV